jgi:CheY-like chemotaxis protein
MQVLLVEDDRSTRLATAKLAESLGHRVHAVETAEEAMTLLSRGGVELLFTDLVLPKKSGIELTQWVRSREKDSHLYVLLLTSRDSSQMMQDAFAAGVDDFVKKGASTDEIAARFRVAERIVRIEQQMRTRAEELESALRRLDISAAMRGGKTAAAPAVAPVAPARKELLSDLRTWKNNEATLRTVLSENIQAELATAAVPTVWAADALAARIALTDVEHKVEMEIFLVAEHASVHKIACNIFGDPEMVDEALVADTMLELANGTMGVFKTAFHAEDYRFTAGIPKPVKVQAPDTMLASSPDRRIYTFTCDGVVLTALLGIREKQNRKVKVGALKEGMVLAEALTRSGAMLLKAGTRLSEVLIERLHHIDRDLLVELSDPDG